MNAVRRTIFHRIFMGVWLVLGAGVFGLHHASAQLVTLNETFTGTTLSPGWEVGGYNSIDPTLTATLPNGDPNGSGWLRLTQATGNQSTYAYNTNAFNGENATIAVKFSYAAYGGSGADGITFFLADASKTFGVGAYGGSLGYAQKTLDGTGGLSGGADIAGMSGGYIGLGIDEYGNYSYGTEGRIGGAGFFPGNVSVRGPGDGLTGYEYLGGTGQLTTPIWFDQSTRPTGADARIFQVVITATNQLTVYMQAGQTAPMEALYSIDLSGYARPEDLVVGFTGSTGGSTNIHEIQGLNLTSLKANLWTNGSGTSTWASGGNWDGSEGQIPEAGADILLNNRYVSTAQTINVGTTRVIRSLQIDAPFAYTLNNGTLEFDDQDVLGPSGIFVSKGNGSAAHTVNSALIAGNAIEINNTSLDLLRLTGTLATNGNAVLLSGTGDTTLSGVISGTGSITKAGSGNASLDAPNTFSGGTTLRAGTLTIGNNSALGTGSVVIKGGTLASDVASQVSNALTLQGNAQLSALTTSGPLTQTNGDYTLTMANATHSGAVNLSNNNTARTLTVAVDAGANSTISGTVQNGGTGAGGLTKTGTGTLTLSGANTYTGTTTINAGTIALGASDRLHDASSLNLAGGTLNLAGKSERIGDLTFSSGEVNFGTPGEANYLLFNDTYASPSGVLVISNWENGADIFASQSALTAGILDSIYFSGYGAGATQADAQSVTGYGTGWRPINPTLTGWYTWDSGNNSNRWDRGTNWDGNVVPPTNAKVAFGTGSQTTVDLRTSRTINAMRFNAGSASFNIGAGQGDRLTFSGPTAGSVAFIQQASSNNQRLTMRYITLARNTVMDVTGSGNLAIESAITSSVNLIKDGTGAGRLILSGNNTGLTGNIFVNAGTLQITRNNALGTTAGTTTIGEGATLELANNITSAETITFAGQGVGGGGAIRNLSGNNTLSGPLAYTTNSRINSNAGTLTLSGPITSSTNRELRLGGAGNIVASNVIGIGGGDLVVDATGTITFQGTSANTYTGTTRVESGTLLLNKSAGTDAIAGDLVIGDGSGAGQSAIVELRAANQIRDNSAVSIQSDGLLDLNGYSEALSSLSGDAGARIDNTSTAPVTLWVGGNDSTTFAGQIRQSTGNLTLIKQSGGKLTLLGDSNYAGGTTIESGIIAVGHNNALGSGAVTVQTGGNLELMGHQLSNAMLLSGPGTLAGDGAIQSTSGTNTLTGNITLQDNARLQANTGSSLNLTTGSTSLSGFTLNVGGGGDTTIAQVISGSGGLTKDGTGTLTLSRANTYSGATTIDGGTLRLGTNNALADGTAVTVAGGATLNVDSRTDTIGSLAGAGSVTLGSGHLTAGGNNSTTTFSGAISGTGNFTRTGTGGLTLSGTSTLTGAVNLAGSGGAQTTLVNASGQALGNISSITVGSGNILVLGASDQINNNANLILAGGTFGVNGFSETMRQVSMNSSSTIDYLNDGSILRFDGQIGSVSGLGILNGTLTISNWAGSLSGGGTEQFVVYSTSGAPTVTNITFDGWGAATVIDRSDTLGSGFWEIVPVITGVQWGLNGDGIWNNNTGNWRNSNSGAVSNQPNAIGAIAILGDYRNGSAWAPLTTNPTIDLQTNNRIVGRLIFENSANRNYTIGTGTSGRLDLNTAGYGTSSVQIIVNDNGAHTINANGYVADPLLITNNSTAAVGLDINGTLDFIRGATTSSLTVNGSGTTRIDGRLTRAGTYTGTAVDTLSLVKTGSGKLILGNNNAFNDTALLRQGTLQIENAGALGTSTFTINDANTTPSMDTSFLLGVSGLTFARGFTVSSQGATTTLGGNFTSGTGTFSGAIALNKDISLTAAGSSTITFSGQLAAGSGTQTITKEGSGTVVLSNTANNYNGSTIIAAGTLQLGAANVLPNGTAVSMTGANTTFNLGSFAETIGSLASAQTSAVVNLGSATLTTGGNNSSTQFDGTITGANGGLTKTGSGTMTLTGSNTYTGATNISAGTLVAANDRALGYNSGGTNTTSVAVGATLGLQGGITVTNETLNLAATANPASYALANLDGNNTWTGGISLTGGTANDDVALQIAAGSQLTVEGVVSQATNTKDLLKSGDGTLVFANNNTYTGTTTIGAGTLQLGTGGTTGALGNGAIVNQGSLIVDRSNAYTMSNTISGTGSLTKDGAGTLTLTGANSYSGATNLNGGTVSINADTRLGSASSPVDLNFNGGSLATTASFTLNSNRSINVNSGGGSLSVATGTTLSFGGSITGPGELTLALGGTGVFNLTSDIDFSSGTVFLSGGTLRLSGADLAIGTFRITGNTILDFAGTSSLTIGNFIIDAGATLTVNNWANGIDYFLADHWWTDASMTSEAPYNTHGSAPMNRIQFTGFPGGANATSWVPYDSTYAQITPVPEPSTYGALFLGACVGLFAWRRWRKPRPAVK